MPEETALVETETQTAIVPQGYEGGDGFEDDPLRPASYELVQQLSHAQNAVPGKFRNARTGEHYDSLRVVGVKYYHGRIMFPPGGFSTESKPLCRSMDGIYPITNDRNLTPQAKTCALCPNGKLAWNRGEKPTCKETYRLLFINREFGEASIPGYITIKGTSIPGFRKLVGALREYAAISKAKGEPRSFYDYAFTIQPRLEVSPKGKYYVMDFTNIAKLSEIGKYRDLYNALSHQQITEDVETVETENTEAVEQEIVTI